MTLVANKQTKVSEITASNDVLRHTIFGYQKDEDDPEYDEI